MKLAVTGVGLSTPLGNTLSEAISNTRNKIVPVVPYKPDEHFSNWALKSKFAYHCDLDALDVEHLIPRKDRRWYDPTVISSIYAVDQALEMSDIHLPKHTGVFVGSIRGGAPNLARFGQTLYKQKTKVHPRILLSSSTEYVSNHISAHYQLTGPSMVTSGTCISAIQALDIAEKYLSDSYNDMHCAIVGGTDFMTSSLCTQYFEQLGAIAEWDDEEDPSTLSRPWDNYRKGFVMGEGSVYIIVEPYEKAVDRGAEIRWIIDGIGIANDGAHPTSPDLDGVGAKIAIRDALRKAGTTSNDYKVINGHATSTPVGDAVEYRVLNGIFGTTPYLYSNKSQLGHMMGASGLAELVIGSEAMREKFVPANLNIKQLLTGYGPVINRDIVDLEYDRLMKTSFGFGGRCSAVSVRLP